MLLKSAMAVKSDDFSDEVTERLAVTLTDALWLPTTL
jgi:hypothetical protein